MCLHNSSQIVSLETLEALRTINCWKSHLHLLRVNPSSLLVKILFCQNLCCLPLTTGSSGETHHFTLLRYFFKFLCCISLAGLDILLTCNVTSTESLPWHCMICTAGFVCPGVSRNFILLDKEGQSLHNL